MIKKLASLQLFFILSLILIVSMISGTLIPQNLPAEKVQQIFSPSMVKILSNLGLFNLFHSAWFIGLLVLLGLNTSACILMRIQEKKYKSLPWGALISHTAILVILAGGVTSALLAEKGVLELRVKEANCCVPSSASNGPTIHLPFQVRLADFNIDTYSSGQHFIQVKNLKEGWSESLEVEPGKDYFLKKSVKLNVLRYEPDLRVEKDSASGEWRAYSASSFPNNPALQVEVTASPTKRVWLFAKFPELSHLSNGANSVEKHLDLLYQYVPGKIKQFKSKIEILKESQLLVAAETSVNHPFKFGGYTFYQSGYNPEDPTYSSFQVVKDPGVPLIYAGFILLPLGLTISFYGKKSHPVYSGKIRNILTKIFSSKIPMSNSSFPKDFKKGEDNA
ncbi:MAG: hypothetical protein A3I11_07210 [Elusimicrobia bacterium RIFCSPLOWO2_02_FULL_39_32]|nr:MAG: hypothetical protein A2034_07740 [Elusimicrobia bacterium GWA2_38_7]OGR81456.1 MAG: hypothetical protein A3B80_05415 [Elusimicrobia bacterium RIFCSPHIGHO2_02_FULL_39_36]OGR91975.1 MAG: hypothetical protein A3I11_07210 [Elusimicrobia bacterium RIFCSPLOWO2_02_FULL_39_32]OGR98733.1 MAG: hypothetical protein A3G85_05220 [Elusimicrobia bacterium RIFCSPLOWO2_12_FULL_39_28]